MFAAIDVGTNTVRLLLAAVCAGKIAPVHYYRKITRLGGGCTADKGLTPEAMERTLLSLQEIQSILQCEDITAVRAVGTAALRDAANGKTFIETVLATAGLKIEIIDGEEEGRLCARGVLSALNSPPPRCLIFDIGGGSTEFLVQSEGKTIFQRSYPLGVVTLCEKFSDTGKVFERVERVLDDFIEELRQSGQMEVVLAPDSALIGTAGTVTTLAALQLGMDDYDWRRVNNLMLDRSSLKRLDIRLKGLSPQERENLPGMEKGRGDLIGPGLHIVLRLMAKLDKQKLTVSDFGLLEGLALTLAEEIS